MRKILILLTILLVVVACNRVDAAPDNIKTENAKSRNLAFTVQFEVKPEYVEEFKDSLLYVLDTMAEEDAFVSCYFHKDPEDSTKFTVYEVWNEPSIDAFFKNQITKEYRKEYEENLPKMLQSDRVITVLEPLQEWHK